MRARLLIDPDSGEFVEVGSDAVTSVEPYDFAQAKRVAAQLTRERREAETTLAKRVSAAGAAEKAYRARLREQIITDKAAHGATAGLELARGHQEVVDLREKRDVAQGMVDAAKERLRLCSEDRATFHRLVEWSMQRERMEQGVGG